MLQKFSWREYWTVVIVVVAIYYAIVFLLLYRKGLLKPSSWKRPTPVQPVPSKTVQQPAIERSSAPAVDPAKEVEKQLMSLVDDVTNFLRDIAGKSYVKEEIIMGLQVFIRDYRQFAGTPHQPDINEFLVAEVDNYCSVDLTSEEVDRVWLS